MTDPNTATYFAERVAELERENAQLREVIAASEEVAQALDVSLVYRENERLYAAFANMVAELESKGEIQFRATGCEWCGVALPRLDDDTPEMIRARVRKHVETCADHPLPQARRALAAVQADSNVTLEQRRKAEQDRELALFAMLELARELERTRGELAAVSGQQRADVVRFSGFERIVLQSHRDRIDGDPLTDRAVIALLDRLLSQGDQP